MEERGKRSTRKNPSTKAKRVTRRENRNPAPNEKVSWEQVGARSGGMISETGYAY